MTTFEFGDAAYPPGNYPNQFSGFTFYLGGDTPHVWSQSEVSQIPYGIKIPIWTRSTSGYNGSSDGAAYVAQLEAYGVPKGVRVALDLETLVDGSYVTAFNDALLNAGYRVMAYGSWGYVQQNPEPAGGYWGADWTGSPFLINGTVATQYASNNDYDSSLATDDGLWWGETDPAPAPVPAGGYETRAHANTYTPLAVDGAYGAKSIEALQYVLGVTVDGVQGSQTVEALQVMLASYHGVALVADGVLGPVTTQAVQEKSGATQDGMWGAGTTEAVQRALNTGSFWGAN